MSPRSEARPTLLADAVYRPLRAGNALEDAVSRLMQTIRLGVVAPGEALPAERELAQRFSISRDTVREAIKELSDAGYLESRRGRYGGTFVCDPLPAAPAPGVPSAEEIGDILGLREVLEPARSAPRPAGVSTRPSAQRCGRGSAMSPPRPRRTIAGSTRGCI